MIVVDTNVVAYLYLPNEFTALAEELLRKEPDWVAPVLWKSEFRNILALYVRKSLLDFDRAYAIQLEAEELLSGKEYDVDSYEVLRLAQESHCSAYDCEFVALAKHLGLKLVTVDKGVLRSFPSLAIHLAEAAD
jgi:predicted nucleic acid-binding protein